MEYVDFKTDPYEVLGVPRNATSETIRHAYHKKAKELHPDRQHGRNDNGDKFKVVQQAYETLSDPLRKQIYDLASGGIEKLLFCIVCTFVSIFCLRLSGIILIPWIIIFIPVWLLNCCLVPISCVMASQKEHFLGGLSIGLFVFFTIMLYLKLVNVIELWTTIAIPLILGDVFTFIRSIGRQDSEVACGGIFSPIATIVKYFARSAFLILAAGSIDGMFDLNWWQVYSPMYCRFVCGMAAINFSTPDFHYFDLLVYVLSISTPYIVVGGITGSCSVPIVYSIPMSFLFCCLFQCRNRTKESTSDDVNEHLFGMDATGKPQGHVFVDIPHRSVPTQQDEESNQLSDVD